MEEIRDPGTVTFNDVAICFSQRDWERLASWQKKLYRNIMREIHGALTELGYEIANPEILVRIQQPEKAYFSPDTSQQEIDAGVWPLHSDRLEDNMADTSDRMSALPSVKPDILLRVKMDDVRRENSSQTSAAAKMEEESEDSNSAVFNPELALWIKQEDAIRLEQPSCSSSEKDDRPPPTGEAPSRPNCSGGTWQLRTRSLPEISQDKPTVHRRNGLKLRDKILVLCAYENKKSVGALATQFGVSRAQIVQILKRREELLDALQNNVNGDRIRRRRRTTNDRVNEAVWEWLRSVRGADVTLSGRIIREKALQIAQGMDIQNFKASNGWLDSFKKAHNIQLGSPACPTLAFGEDQVDEWL
ncbi:uncharacterized protein [Hyperolius riggenbachi]|uniref:uncharacterized protein isoform X2 n=1 Tax=Hyperolius riggenbachi TaxID=752182 RepID=UPI0035A327D5